MNEKLRLISLVIVFLAVFSYWLITNQSNQACAQEPCGAMPKTSDLTANLCIGVVNSTCYETTASWTTDGAVCGWDSQHIRTADRWFAVGYSDFYSPDQIQCCALNVEIRDGPNGCRNGN